MAAGANGRGDLSGVFDLLHREAAVDHSSPVELLEEPRRIRVAFLEVRADDLFGRLQQMQPQPHLIDRLLALLGEMRADRRCEDSARGVVAPRTKEIGQPREALVPQSAVRAFHARGQRHPGLRIRRIGILRQILDPVIGIVGRLLGQVEANERNIEIQQLRVRPEDLQQSFLEWRRSLIGGDRDGQAEQMDENQQGGERTQRGTLRLAMGHRIGFHVGAWSNQPRGETSNESVRRPAATRPRSSGIDRTLFVAGQNLDPARRPLPSG